jgi:hypothetical protein
MVEGSEEHWRNVTFDSDPNPGRGFGAADEENSREER